ncbi:hypothetical protein SCOR_10255 [Sulfidibacter corallicola]
MFECESDGDARASREFLSLSTRWTPKFTKRILQVATRFIWRDHFTSKEAVDDEAVVAQVMGG